MKKPYKILIFLLALVLTVSAFACGCNSSGEKPGENGGGSVNPPVVYTDKELVKNGASEYKIVIPAAASNKEELAASEFNDIFALSTGFELPVINDAGLTYSKNDKYILIGLNSLSESLGIKPERSELGEQGYIVKTIDSSVVITGATKNGFGTLYGVYEFMSYQVDFECYAEDETFVEQYRDCKLVSVDIKDKPDIENVIVCGDAYVSNMQFQYRNRFVSLTNDLFVGRTTPYHSSFFYLPKETYAKDHPKWYSDAQDQICYYAHGDEKEYKALVDTLFDILVDVVKENENIQHIGFNIEDTTTFCTCATCTAKKLQYNGANSAGCIILMNNISKRFEEARKTDDALKDRILDFCFFAYKETFLAPARYDEATGKYVPVANEVVCRDDVYPFVCTFNANRAETLTSSKNASAKATIDAWGALSDHIAFWTYTENYNDYLAPRDCITMMQENYKYISSFNPIFYKEESQGVNYNGTGFQCMKYWLQYKTAWNVNVNTDALIDEYFDHYFQDAKEPMMKFYNSYTTHLRRLAEEQNYSQFDNLNILKPERFSYGLLNGWLEYINEAYAKIDYLKNENPAQYQKLKKRIAIESVTVNYSIISLYGNNFSTDELRSRVESFKEDVTLARINYWDDNSKRLVQDFIDANMG